MDTLKYGQAYPTFQTQSYFNTIQDQKDASESNYKNQQHKYSKDSDNSISPIQYQQSSQFQVETSEFMKFDNDSNNNVTMVRNDSSNSQQQQSNANTIFGNVLDINNQIPSNIQKKSEENQETLRQLKEFLIDKLENVPLTDVYQNYQMLTNYCLKQQFLLQNKHFDPKTYFQGRKISEDDLNEVFNERKTSTHIDDQNMGFIQQYEQNDIQQNQKQSNLLIENNKIEQNQIDSNSPQTPPLIGNTELGYAKYSQPVKQMKKNSSNFSSTSTKTGQQPNSVTNSYINNSNQAIDMSRSLLQSKNLMLQGSTQMINNYQDYFLMSDQNKCENTNTQNIEKFTLSSQDNKELKKDQTLNYFKTNNLKNYNINAQNNISDFSKNGRIFANKISYSPKNQIDQQITSFESQGLEKNKSYIQQIRDQQDQQNQKSSQGMQQNNQKYFSSLGNAINSIQIQSPNVGILKNVQINLFSNRGNSLQSTDSSKRYDQMNSSGRLRSSNAISPKSQKQDQMKNSFTQKDRPASILKTSSQLSSNQILSNQILSPASSTSQRNSSRKSSITNFNLNNKSSPKSSMLSSKQQYVQFNENGEIDNQKEKSFSNQQFEIFQKFDSGKRQEREKQRKSISIHLDQTKYYEYNNQSPVCKSTENKNQKSIDQKFKSSKFQQSSTSSQLKKDQIKLSNEINKISNILDFSKEFNELKNITSSTQQIMNNSIQSKLFQETNQNKENSKAGNKKQQHYTIPLIKALNLTKLSSQPQVSEDNASQRETKDINMINSRNASPTHPQSRDKRIGSPRDELNKIEAKRSCSLQPTPRDNPDQKINYVMNNRENSITRNIESVIQILNNKVKGDNQNSQILRNNQSLSLRKNPLSPSQRNLSRGQTVISNQNSSTFQNQEINLKNSSQVFPNNNSTMNNNGSMSQKNIYQPQLSQKYSQIYQQMESLNQKFNMIGQQSQGQSLSHSNSNNTSQIFNQPIIFSQTNISNVKYQSKSNLRMTKKNFQ